MANFILKIILSLSVPRCRWLSQVSTSVRHDKVQILSSDGVTIESAAATASAAAAAAAAHGGAASSPRVVSNGVVEFSVLLFPFSRWRL